MEKAPQIDFFPGGWGWVPNLAPPYSAYEQMHNIFGHYSSHNDTTKYSLECTELNYFLKNFSEAHIPSNPLEIKLNTLICTTRSTTQAG